MQKAYSRRQGHPFNLRWGRNATLYHAYTSIHPFASHFTPTTHLRAWLTTRRCRRAGFNRLTSRCTDYPRSTTVPGRNNHTVATHPYTFLTCQFTLARIPLPVRGFQEAVYSVYGLSIQHSHRRNASQYCIYTSLPPFTSGRFTPTEHLRARLTTHCCQHAGFKVLATGCTVYQYGTAVPVGNTVPIVYTHLQSFALGQFTPTTHLRARLTTYCYQYTGFRRPVLVIQTSILWST